MSSNNPKHKPLHRIRNIRNASRNAKQFPQLAEHLFDPAHARKTVYPKTTLDIGVGICGIVAPPGMPPQPNMQQFYTAPTVSLQPIRFASEQDKLAYHQQWATAGFVPFIKNGNNQFKRMMQLGLDPRIPPSAEELRRREEHEAKVKVFRDNMTLDTIIENSGGGKWRKEGPFPGWTENPARSRQVKAAADTKETEQTEAEQETGTKAT